MNLRHRRRRLHALFIFRDWTSYPFVRAFGCACPRTGPSAPRCPANLRNAARQARLDSETPGFQR